MERSSPSSSPSLAPLPSFSLSFHLSHPRASPSVPLSAFILPRFHFISSWFLINTEPLNEQWWKSEKGCKILFSILYYVLAKVGLLHPPPPPTHTRISFCCKCISISKVLRVKRKSKYKIIQSSPRETAFACRNIAIIELFSSSYFFPQKFGTQTQNVSGRERKIIGIYCSRETLHSLNVAYCSPSWNFVRLQKYSNIVFPPTSNYFCCKALWRQHLSDRERRRFKKAVIFTGDSALPCVPLGLILRKYWIFSHPSNCIAKISRANTECIWLWLFCDITLKDLNIAKFFAPSIFPLHI